MKNNKSIFYIALSFVALIVALGSCKKDVTFPDPGFDALVDQKVDIRRDTADFYQILLKVDAPNGIETIELLDGMKYTSLESFPEYNGKKDFQFEYKVDLSSINTDTTLYYIIKIIDKDLRSINKGFVINVKPFSFPEVYYNGGDTVKYAVPTGVEVSLPLKALITTGMNSIKTITVLFDDEVKYQFEAPSAEDTLIYSHAIIEKIPVILQKDTYHTMKFIMVDDKGQEGIQERKVRVGEVQKPIRVERYLTSSISSSYSEFNFTYDDQNRLSELRYDHQSGNYYNVTYIYNENGVVESVKSVGWNAYKAETAIHNWTFLFNEGTNEIFQVTESEWVLPDGQEEAELISENTVVLENFVYNTNGLISSLYSVVNATSVPFTYEDGFLEGEYLSTDNWSDGAIDFRSRYHTYKVGFEPVSIPSFAEEVPQFPLRRLTFASDLSILLFSKYVFTESGRYIYTYENDGEGRLSTLNSIRNAGFSSETITSYNFIYE